MATGGFALARARACALLLAVSASALLLGGAATAQEEDVGTLLKRATALSVEGKHQEALQLLRAALAKDPSSEQILTALDSAQYRELLALIAAGGDVMKAAQEILRRAHPELPDRAFNQEDLNRLVHEAVTAEDYNTRFEAAMSLARTYGEFAVPGLVAFLGSNNLDHRSNAHITLMRRIGRDAVLPLNQALRSENAEVRRWVAAELQHIADERSLPALAEAVERETDADVKAKLRAALDALVQKYPYAQGLGASALYLKLASLYYNDVYRVRSYADKPLVVWRWDGGLARRPVPRHLYTLKLAEQAAYDALRVNAENGAARALLARILLAEHLAADAVAGVSEEESAKRAAEELKTVPWVVGALGWTTLSWALNDALAEDDTRVAVAILRIMPNIYGASEFSSDSPVVRATKDDANAVRFAAAEAVLRFNGVRRISAFPDPDAFLSFVAQAVGEIVPRQILVVDPDDVRRNKVVTDLHEQKYLAYPARTGGDGIVRAVNFAGLDMVIVSADLPDMDPLGFIARLREDERTRNVPIVLLATDAQLADPAWTQPFDGKVQGMTSIPEGPGLPTEAFRGVVNGAFAGPGPDVQARYAASAGILDALAATDTGNTLFHWSALTGDLTRMLEADVPEEPPVKRNAIRALGNLGDPAAVDPLAAFLAKSGESAALRAAAAGAITAICRRGEVRLGAGAFEALRKGTADADESVRAAAFVALGSASLDAAQAWQIARENVPGEGAAPAAGGEEPSGGGEGDEMEGGEEG
jgi:HEAT repeat protein